MRTNEQTGRKKHWKPTIAVQRNEQKRAEDKPNTGKARIADTRHKEQTRKTKAGYTSRIQILTETELQTNRQAGDTGKETNRDRGRKAHT